MDTLSYFSESLNNVYLFEILFQLLHFFRDYIPPLAELFSLVHSIGQFFHKKILPQSVHSLY